MRRRPGAFQGLADSAVPGSGAIEETNRDLGQGSIRQRSHIEQVVRIARQVSGDAALEVPVGVVILVLPPSPTLHADRLAGFGALREGDEDRAFLGIVALRRTKVAPVVAPVVDHRGGLELADERVDRRVYALVDIHVPPKPMDRAVVRHQLRHLGAHILGVLVQIGAIARLRRQLVVTPLVRVVRVMPVRDRVVEAERKLPPVTGLGQFLQQVAGVGGVSAVEVGVLRRKQAESVVMFGREAQVSHAIALGHVQPGVGIELRRIPTRRELAVLRARDAAAPLVLLVPSFDRVQAPVHEQSVATLKPPVAGIAKTKGERRRGRRRGDARRSGGGGTRRVGYVRQERSTGQQGAGSGQKVAAFHRRASQAERRPIGDPPAGLRQPQQDSR